MSSKVQPTSSSSRKGSVAGSDTAVTTLEQKNRYLENEVKELKKRLDELRLAKNNTVIKNETRVLETGAPNLGPGAKPDNRSEKKISELKRQLKETEERLENERLVFSAQLEQMKDAEIAAKDCGHTPIIDSMNTEIVSLHIRLEENEKEIQGLLDELSLKEASWCEAEERYQQEHRAARSSILRLQTALERLQTTLPRISQTQNYLQQQLDEQNPNGGGSA